MCYIGFYMYPEKSEIKLFVIYEKVFKIKTLFSRD